MVSKQDDKEEDLKELSPNEGVDPDDLENPEEVKENSEHPDEPESHEEMDEPNPSEDEETSSLENDDSEEVEPEDSQDGKEHTLEDLAKEPQKPRSFGINDDTDVHSQIPSSGLYSSDRGSLTGKRRGGNKSKVGLLFLIAILVLGGSVYLLKGKFKNLISSSPSPSPSSEELSSPSPTPSPVPSLDRSKYTIRILNGTSTSGLAASVSAKLKDLGYKTTGVGNATNSAFTQTQIRAKNTLSSLIDQLTRDLSPDYSGASSASALKDSDAADGEVILGTK